MNMASAHTWHCSPFLMASEKREREANIEGIRNEKHEQYTMKESAIRLAPELIKTKISQ